MPAKKKEAPVDTGPDLVTVTEDVTEEFIPGAPGVGTKTPSTRLKYAANSQIPRSVAEAEDVPHRG